MTDFTRLQKQLSPQRDGDPVISHRTGVVAAVNSDGTVDLILGAVTVPDVQVLGGTITGVGESVQVAVWAGDLLVLGSTRTAGQYIRGGILDILSTTTFTPANFPGLRAVRFLVQAGGGSGGGANITTTNASCGGGGAAGTYGETVIIPIADVIANESPTTITVGGGASAQTGGGGLSGGVSAVGASGNRILTCPGGGGGGILAAGTTTTGIDGGGSGGAATSPAGFGFFTRQPQRGQHGFRFSAASAEGGEGGSNLWGSGGGERWTSGDGRDATGLGRGGGGGGAVNGQSQGAARPGGVGAAGRVMIELYY